MGIKELHAEVEKLSALLNEIAEYAPAHIEMVRETAELTCPESYGFEGTFPDCGECVVCKARAKIVEWQKP
jgi:hypothetical protein